MRKAFIMKENLTTVFFDLKTSYDPTGIYGMKRDLWNLELR